MILYLIKTKPYNFKLLFLTYVSHKLMQKRNQNDMSKSEIFYNPHIVLDIFNMYKKNK